MARSFLKPAYCLFVLLTGQLALSAFASEAGAAAHVRGKGHRKLRVLQLGSQFTFEPECIKDTIQERCVFTPKFTIPDADPTPAPAPAPAPAPVPAPVPTPRDPIPAVWIIREAVPAPSPPSPVAKPVDLLKLFPKREPCTACQAAKKKQVKHVKYAKPTKVVKPKCGKCGKKP